MKTPSGCHRFIHFVVLFFVIAGCGGGGGGGGNDHTPADTTPPVTTAFPAGGIYGSVQSVTLTASESATIYYSLDGIDPSVGGANTISGASPLPNIEVSSATLKFFAIDTAGNREPVKSETFIIDLAAPTVSFNAPAPGLFGLLTAAVVSWQSDEDVDYTVELGGTGAQGSGVELMSGSTDADAAVTLEIKGTQLSFSQATTLHVYATDPVGHKGYGSLQLHMKPLAVIPVGGEVWDIEITAGADKAYISNTGNDRVAVIDIDPGSETYHTEIATISVGTRPVGIAATPDGERVYVTNNGSTNLDTDSISVIATATDTVMVTSDLGSATAPAGIAIAPDGKRGYFTSFEQKVYVLDTDPDSPTFNLVLTGDSIPIPLLMMGEIAVSPDGKKAVVNWQGMIAHGVDVIDTDPASPGFLTVSDSIVPVISGIHGGIAFSPDNQFVYITSADCILCQVDLSTYDILNSYSDLNPGGGIALTQDGLYLLHSDLNDTALYVFDASDLTLIGSVDLGERLGKAIAITPDGSRAYLFRAPVSASSEVVVVPLE